MKKREYFMEKKPARAIALLPIGVFLVLYLGLGCLFEYGLKIKMGFYNIPIVVAFLAAILVACLQNRALSFDDKLEVMAKGVGDKNIMTMILIFLAAGVFVGVAVGTGVFVGVAVGTGVGVVVGSSIGILSFFVFPHTVQLKVRIPAFSTVGFNVTAPASQACPVATITFCSCNTAPQTLQ